MAKGLVFDGLNNKGYGFISRAAIYKDAIASATGLTEAEQIPRTGLPVPWRLQDLLQAGELKSVTVVLSDGTSKKTNRRLYITNAKIPTFRNLSTAGGLVGATLGGKTILSATIPRKASFRLL
ncbi:MULTISPECIES: hypothetical protein [unclassified Microcoleus]|uniref:hypothetical protein n=1 Tax=unclassified Microcoleus TaxID=2642155 RepID=UPI002FD48AD1